MLVELEAIQEWQIRVRNKMREGPDEISNSS
jgi:hypothetical protein